jgi:hypothetical protein
MTASHIVTIVATPSHISGDQLCSYGMEQLTLLLNRKSTLSALDLTTLHSEFTYSDRTFLASAFVVQEAATGWTIHVPLASILSTAYTLEMVETVTSISIDQS